MEGLGEVPVKERTGHEREEARVGSQCGLHAELALAQPLAADAQLAVQLPGPVRARMQAEAAPAELSRAAEEEERLPFEFGPPATYKPPRELEGEVLLRLNRPGEAVRAFRQALRRTPERAATLLGLARASARAGDTATALATYRQLKAIWHRADPGYPPLAEAATYLAREVSERP